ncbi:hypothetical protein RISK_002142 [Rhodopirellula islandica]|uniref:Uncharacterized protein n=1 Tax=Rhodopirellula islandica TaxID=595434 RepID=A0A0J1BG47_RHOIS|nr:hypothetical protein RISK_002142 [Rhodopirellula islandica]
MDHRFWTLIAVLGRVFESNDMADFVRSHSIRPHLCFTSC